MAAAGPPPSTAPAVSVLVTTYRHAAYVEEALDSLAAQTFADVEVLITDDASPDGTADVIQRWLDRTGFAATFVRNPENAGICANRNRALARARGEFVCSLAGDDAYAPDRIERQVAHLRTRPPSVAGVFSDMEVVDAEGRTTGPSFFERLLGDEPPPRGRAAFERLVTRGNFLPAPATMVRRQALLDVGGYDEALAVEDYQMWLKLFERYDLEYVPGRLVRYREVDSSLSRAPERQAAKRRSHARLLSSWLGRTEWDQDLLRRLWALGRKQHLHGDDEGAAWTFRAVARHDRRPVHLAVAAVASVPGGARAIRGIAGVRRRLPRGLRRRLGDPG